MQLGIDISHTDVNKVIWSIAKNAGVRFAVLRADYAKWQDPGCVENYQAAKDAGLVVGGYLFVTEQQDAPAPEVQGKALVDTLHAAGIEPGVDLPPVIDIEFPDGGTSTGRKPKELLDRTLAVWHVVHDAFGVAPIIYTSARVWHEDLKDQEVPEEILSSPLWVVRYVTGAKRLPVLTESSLPAPSVPSPWGDDGNWWLHQFQGDSVGLAGFSCRTDLDRFKTAQRGPESKHRAAWIQKQLKMAELSSEFDLETEAAVKAFQSAHALDPDGIVGLHTFCALAWA